MSHKEPTRFDRMKELARAGDIDGVLDLIFDPGDLAEAMKAIRVGLCHMAKDNPEALITCLNGRALAFTGALMVRAQLNVDQSLAKVAHHCPGDIGIPENVSKEWLPRVQVLQEEVRRISKEMATMAHTMALAKSQQREPAKNVVPITTAKQTKPRSRQVSRG